MQQKISPSSRRGTFCLLSRAHTLHSPFHLFLLLLINLWIFLLALPALEPWLDYAAPQHVDGPNWSEEEKQPEPVGYEG